MKSKYVWSLLIVVAVVAVAAGGVVATDGKKTVSTTPAPQASIESYPWLETPLSSEIAQCAADRGVELYAAPFDSVEMTRMAGKGKGKPNPCKTCATTLGPCERFSCSPCCYTCPDLPFLVCIDL